MQPVVYIVENRNFALMDRKKYWEKIYHTTSLAEASWYQATPEVSLAAIRQLDIQKTDKIIDVGGGDSLFVDHLLNMGFQNITVLDISKTAIERAKSRLGQKAEKVKWIISDITNFHPAEKYDFWHDRATFHFLTNEEDIAHYIDTTQKGIATNGILIIGTFSECGPEKCSGIQIRQYSESQMTERFKMSFDKIKCLQFDHTTPMGTIQNFIFCHFRKTKMR